uniref:Uncharacterized protein n=1 Tax=viral metagenome TaxID=1070528 RepID=A0A6C0BRB2_9ZZZZ
MTTDAKIPGLAETIRKLVKLHPYKLTNIQYFSKGKKTDKLQDYLDVYTAASPYLQIQLRQVLIVSLNLLNVTERPSALQED